MEILHVDLKILQLESYPMDIERMVWRTQDSCMDRYVSKFWWMVVAMQYYPSPLSISNCYKSCASLMGLASPQISSGTGKPAAVQPGWQKMNYSWHGYTNPWVGFNEHGAVHQQIKHKYPNTICLWVDGLPMPFVCLFSWVQVRTLGSPQNKKPNKYIGTY